MIKYLCSEERILWQGYRQLHAAHMAGSGGGCQKLTVYFYRIHRKLIFQFKYIMGKSAGSYLCSGRYIAYDVSRLIAHGYVDFYMLHIIVVFGRIGNRGFSS